MKRVLAFVFLSVMAFTGYTQVTVTIGEALLTPPGTDVHLPVTVQGLNGTTGGVPVTSIELHIAYAGTVLEYDTTVNFFAELPGPEWNYFGNGIEYAAVWMEPSLLKKNIPDNTILFDVVFHYSGGTTQLVFDTIRSILTDSAFEIIHGVHFVNGKVTPSQGSEVSRWNGTGSWNTVANWSNGIPGDSTDVVIESGAVSILSNAVCKNMIIRSGTQTIISGGSNLTVNKSYTNEGILRLLSNAVGTGSLIVTGTITGAGTNTFEHYFDFSQGLTDLSASPVTGATASVFNTAVAESYQESSDSWSVLAPATPLEQAAGYRISGNTAYTFAFQGMFTGNSVQKSNLSYTPGNPANFRGLNLIGNPYPSYIRWNQGNWIKTNLEGAVYAWDGYKYITWNGAVGALSNGQIKPMQGFFAKASASGASLTIPADSRSHGTVTKADVKQAEAISNLLVMTIVNTNPLDSLYNDETYINILPGSTLNFDPATDAYKLAGNAGHPEIYTLAGDNSVLSINTQPDFTAIPVGIHPETAGTYKIRFRSIETFQPDQPLFFEDKTTQSVINLRNLNEYVFTSDGSLETGRMVLHFSQVGMEENLRQHFTIWMANRIIYLVPVNGDMQIQRIELFNMSGQKISTTESPVNLPALLSVDRNLSGLIIIRITTNEGVFCQKLLVR